MNMYEVEKLLEDDIRHLKYVDQNGWKYPNKVNNTPKILQLLLFRMSFWKK